MKKPLVSLVGALICAGIFLAVGAFGWSRYKAARARENAYSIALQSYSPKKGGNKDLARVLTGEEGSQLSVHMPAPLGSTRERGADTSKLLPVDQDAHKGPIDLDATPPPVPRR